MSVHCTTAHHVLAAAARAAGTAVDLLRRVWAAHRRLLLSNAGYAATIAALAAALATQTEAAELLAALLAGVLAIHRSLRHHVAY